MWSTPTWTRVSRFLREVSVRPVCTIPADDVNTYADQLDHDITSVLDQLAPTRMKTRRCGKRSGRWLSDEAVQVKRQRRRLEARWRRTKLETDESRLQEGEHSHCQLQAIFLPTTTSVSDMRTEYSIACHT